MAEVAALSLAANIFQFLDYGKQFASLVWDIYNDGTEGVELLSHLRSRSKDLHLLLAELRAATARSGGQAQATHDEGIHLLAQKCADLLKRMVDTLEKIEQRGMRRRRDAAKQALKVLWNQKELESLEQSLNQFRDDLVLGISISIRAAARKSLDNQEEILRRLNTIEKDTHKPSYRPNPAMGVSSGFGSSIVDYVTQQADASEEVKGELVAALAKLIYREAARSDDAEVPNMPLSTTRSAQLQRKFLTRLWYQRMDERHSSIHLAHEKTFRWVFEETTNDNSSWSSLPMWLKSDNQVYWVTGKAGSGKSTLMGYISQAPDGDTTQPPRCAEFLRTWAGSKRPLIIACFYFWAAGSDLQKSQAGLFRTLLYQLLTESPESIPYVSPNRWELLSLFNEDCKDFGEGELREMFLRAVERVSASANVVLFVDGLDEFDGETETLIHLLRQLTRDYPIKLCVASRPWVEFENEFQKGPSLKLEDLTRSDIKDYVAARFQDDGYFVALQTIKPVVADDLFNAIVKKSSGVFLWVRLVVDSLLRGLTAGDRVEDVQARLALLPADLEKLYERIIDQIDQSDPLYRGHAFQYFQLMKASPSPPSLLMFSYADESESDFVKIALSIGPDSFKKSEVDYRVDEMRRRLNSRCKGLLETTHSGNEGDFGTVQYLHKTVMEYIDRPEVQEKLRQGSSQLYDPNIRLIAGSLAILKARRLDLIGGAYSQWRDKSCDGVRALAKVLMDHASRSLPSHAPDVVLLLDDFRQTSMQPKQGEQELSWAQRNGGLSDLDECVTLAAEHMVLSYVNARVGSGCLVDMGRRRLPFRDSVMGLWHNRIWKKHEGFTYPLLFAPPLDHPSSTAMLKLMLSRGANPNFTKGMELRSRHWLPLNLVESQSTVSGEGLKTPWVKMLVTIIWAFSSTSGLSDSRLQHVSDCARVMVDHGAKVNQGTVESALAWYVNGQVKYEDARHARFCLRPPEVTGGIEKRIHQALIDMQKDRRRGFVVGVDYEITMEELLPQMNTLDRWGEYQAR